MDIQSFVIGYQQGLENILQEDYLNIAYGETPPEDTSKLWVKSSKAKSIEIREETILPIMDETLVDARYGAGQAIVGNKLYLLGGGGFSDTNADGSNCNATNTILCFDMLDRTCTKLSLKLPFYAYGINCAAIGTDIYIFGGYGNESKWSSAMTIKTIYRFDTVEMKFIKLSATMPVGLCGSGMGVLGSKIYMFGGATHWGTNNTQKYVYCFDVDTQELKALKQLSDNRTHIGVVPHNDKLYLLGGFNSYGRTTVQIYDPETDTYTDGKALPVSYGNGTGFARIGSKIYLPSGFYPGNSSSLAQQMRNTLAVYDLDTQTGYVTDYIFPYKFHYANCGCLNGDIYVLGGTIADDDATYGYRNTNTIVKVPTDLPLENQNLWIKVASGYPNIVLDCTESVSVGVNVTKVYLGNPEDIGEPVEAALYKNGEWKPI